MTSNRKINKTDLTKLLNQWRQGFTVIIPHQENGLATWAEWDGSDTSFTNWYQNTVIPAKTHFLASKEEMFLFQKDGKGYRIEQPASDKRKRLILGIRPCDAKAITILDTVFKELYEDPYYLAKRNNTVLVGLGCTRPCESCFCTSMGISPGESNDVDLMLTNIGDHLLIDVISEAGKGLVSQVSEVTEATEADEAKAKEAKEASYRKVTRKADISNIKERLSACFEDKEHWEKIAAKCISCGICTLLCPTCFCFDINDELFKKQGTRFRSWDSCAFSVYTKMPMENPREEKWRRVRQKVCHKFEFHPLNYDVIACVGCGRCIRRCPVNWDITQVINNFPTKA